MYISITNLILYLYVCLTNFYGFKAYDIESNPILCTGLMCSMFASFAMHVYEIRRFTDDMHISVLKQDNVYNWLVRVDKAFAYTTIALYVYYKYDVIILYVPQAIFAVLLAIFSTETPTTQNNNTLFAITHGTWHFIAFRLAYLYSLGDISMPIKQ